MHLDETEPGSRSRFFESEPGWETAGSIRVGSVPDFIDPGKPKVQDSARAIDRFFRFAIGPGFAKNVIELDAPPADNVRRLAKAKGVDPSAINVLVLDRPRHADIIQGVGAVPLDVRATGVDGT